MRDFIDEASAACSLQVETSPSAPRSGCLGRLVHRKCMYVKARRLRLEIDMCGRVPDERRSVSHLLFVICTVLYVRSQYHPLGR